MPASLRTLLWLLLAIGLLYAAVVAMLIANQERFLFQPIKLPPDFAFNQAGVVERSIDVPGAKLSALHYRQENARGLIFFLHGNAGNLDIWLPSTDFYQRNKFDLFMIDYRGFGKSTDQIDSEAQLHADVRAAWDSVAREYAGRPIVIYGRSLGAGLAAKLASEVHNAQLIMVSPYSSFVQLGRDHFPWVPPQVTRYPMRTDEWLASVKAPIVMIHGAQDALIKPSHAHALKRLRPDAKLHIIDGAGHNDIHSFPAYIAVLSQHLATLK